MTAPIMKGMCFKNKTNMNKYINMNKHNIKRLMNDYYNGNLRLVILLFFVVFFYVYSFMFVFVL